MAEQQPGSASSPQETTNAGTQMARPQEQTLAGILQCMLTMQRQQNDLAETVKRLAPPAHEAAAPAVGTALSTGHSATGEPSATEESSASTSVSAPPNQGVSVSGTGSG